MRGPHPRHDEDHSRESGEDSRPKLVPGVLLSLSRLSVEAIMAFTEEVKECFRFVHVWVTHL